MSQRRELQIPAQRRLSTRDDEVIYAKATVMRPKSKGNVLARCAAHMRNNPGLLRLYLKRRTLEEKLRLHRLEREANALAIREHSEGDL